jgi:hypothetical protein
MTFSTIDKGTMFGLRSDDKIKLSLGGIPKGSNKLNMATCIINRIIFSLLLSWSSCETPVKTGVFLK